MYKLGDIVAVYGETSTGNTLNTSHPSFDTDLMNSADLARIIENASRFHICEVRRILAAEKGWTLVVQPVGRENKYIVSSKQVRLVEREGKPVSAHEAKYLSLTQINDGEDGTRFSILNNLASAIATARNDKADFTEAYDPEDNSFEYWIFKGIDITSEVEL